MIRAGTKRRLSPVPDTNEEMDTSQLFCPSPMRWCCCGARRNRGSIGAARHTPFEKHASKHVLMHLAASQPCQANGWASDSGLHILSSLYCKSAAQPKGLLLLPHPSFGMQILPGHEYYNKCEYTSLWHHLVCHLVNKISIKRLDYKSFERSLK